jgi:hypothetical protein
MLEATVVTHAFIERILAGVTKGGMAEVVSKGDGLTQIFVQVERTGNGAGDLRHFDGVRQAGAEHVAFVIDEDLGLVLEAAKLLSSDAA